MKKDLTQGKIGKSILLLSIVFPAFFLNPTPGPITTISPVSSL